MSGTKSNSDICGSSMETHKHEERPKKVESLPENAYRRSHAASSIGSLKKIQSLIDLQHAGGPPKRTYVDISKISEENLNLKRELCDVRMRCYFLKPELPEICNVKGIDFSDDYILIRGKLDQEIREKTELTEKVNKLSKSCNSWKEKYEMEKDEWQKEKKKLEEKIDQLTLDLTHYRNIHKYQVDNNGVDENNQSDFSLSFSERSLEVEEWKAAAWQAEFERKKMFIDLNKEINDLSEAIKCKEDIIRIEYEKRTSMEAKVNELTIENEKFDRILLDLQENYERKMSWKRRKTRDRSDENLSCNKPGE